MKNDIYFDYNATTPVDPEVLTAALPYFLTTYENAASRHKSGSLINQEINIVREMLLGFLHSKSGEIIFASGATEAINLGLIGFAEYNKVRGKHIVTCRTEHPAVLDSCKYLEKQGFEITYLPVRNDGLINPQELKNAIKEDTILVSIMFVNNETGVIQDIKTLSTIAHENGSYFMTDATQAFSKIDINVEELGIDILTFSGHKFYATKGVGGLYIRNKRPFKVRLNALQHGGGHENGFRSGTLNVPGIIGIGKAIEIASTNMLEESTRIGKLRDHLEESILNMVEGSYVNGDISNRIYNTSNICLKNIDADALIAGLDTVMISNGSACSSTKIEPSHVLTAMGLEEREAYSSIRLSIGRFTTEEDILKGSEIIIKEINKIKNNMIV
ncbi:MULTISPECIES: cysteine desulfurase family protein [unclassified Sphingobacterium]|uniref:cysteine desulfurase family protein n=1 Tax=unclassified Sphingobacterium TaxID=2609468 RepID=UPI0025EAEB27|nr:MULTISPECIES: cysteine desulfurase family protein [unclassified Sphingobacterium]